MAVALSFFLSFFMTKQGELLCSYEVEVTEVPGADQLTFQKPLCVGPVLSSPVSSEGSWLAADRRLGPAGLG